MALNEKLVDVGFALYRPEGGLALIGIAHKAFRNIEGREIPKTALG